MKRLAALIAIFALAASVAGTADAALLAKSPALSPGGYPLWFQDQAGMALQGCLNDPPLNPGFCFLPNMAEPGAPPGTPIVIVQPGFKPFDPKVFPTNYPNEQFYFLATSAPVVLPGGTTPFIDPTAQVELAVEGSFNPLIIANPNQEMFHRLRVLIIPNNINAQGTYTIRHPWGETVIPPQLQQNPFGAGGARGRATIDVNFGAPLGNIASVPNNFEGLLADNPLFTVSNFLTQTTPAPPKGFLGDCLTESPVTGGPVRNEVEILDPNGVSIIKTNLFIVCGQKVGHEVSPTTASFGVWKPGSAPQTTTFTVTNLSGAAIPLRDLNAVPQTGLVLTSSNQDFTIDPADGCANGMTALAPGNTCSFDVIFTPTAAGTAAGTVAISSAGNPDIVAAVSGTIDGEVPQITAVDQFTKTTGPTTISGSVSDNVAVSSVQVTINGGAPQAATVNGTTWSLAVTNLNANAVNSISVTALDTAQPGGNSSSATATITHDDIPPAVTLAAPQDGLITSDPNQTLTFTPSDANRLTTVVRLNGSDLANPPATLVLPDGVHTIAVEATDAAGNITTVTNTITIALPNGNIDGTGNVTIADALQALRAAVGLITITPGSVPFFHGNVAPIGALDDKIGIDDALAILRAAVGLITL